MGGPDPTGLRVSGRLGGAPPGPRTSTLPSPIDLARRGFDAFVGTYRSFPRTIRILFAGQSLISTGNGAIYPFLGLYVTERFGVDVVVAGLVTSTFFLCSAIASPVAGTLSDRIGRRRVILVALAFDALFLAALALAPSIELVFAAIVGAGLTGTGAYPAVQAVVADTVPEDRRGVVYGSMYQALGLGWFLGPVLAAPVLAVAGFGGVFALATLMILLALMLFAARLPETLVGAGGGGRRAAAGNLPVAAAGEAVEAVPVDGVARGSAGRGVPGPTAWYRDRRLLLYVGLHLLTFGAYIQLFGIFPIDGRDRLGLEEGAWAAILALNGAMILFGQGLLSAAVRRFHRPFVVAAGVVLWAVGFAGLGLAWNAALVLPAVVILTLGEMLVFPLQPAVVADLAPEEARGTYQGALTMGGSIGNAVAPAVAGLAVAQLGGSWWLVLGALLLGLAAGYVAFGRVVMVRAPEGVGAR